jgi:hypothetical protein
MMEKVEICDDAIEYNNLVSLETVERRYRGLGVDMDVNDGNGP